MANYDNTTVVRQWATEVVKSGAPRKRRGGTVWTDADGVIHYGRTSGQKRNAWGAVVLGRYLPRRKTVLLNGDGFTDRSATHWQTQLRNNVTTQRYRHGHKFAENLVVIPYAALAAAGIVFDSIRPIDIISDELEEVWHKVDLDESDFEGVEPKMMSDWERYREIRKDGTTIRLMENRRSGYQNPDGRKISSNEYHRVPYSERKLWSLTKLDWARRPNAPFRVMSRDENGRTQSMLLAEFDEDALSSARQNRLEQNDRAARGVQWSGAVLTGEIPSVPGWYWREQVHHLGACLFSAVDGSGGRHKFVSAFDEEEQNRMYFLAQLPDRSGATTYQEALLALAPQMVHKARLEGRTVLRQGDVFAIHTDLTDEEVYARAKTRVRRAVALYDQDAQKLLAVMRGVQEEPAVLPGEVTERVECLCKCGHKRTVGWGPKARRALMIYGTGHTAAEVVTTAKGVVYIKGVMHHDPYLQEPGRRAEHAAVTLGVGWWLCLRNTVPRKQARSRQTVEAEEVAA